MIRQQAFTGDCKFLKGALHFHTTRSDGDLTPEQALRKYRSLGYDFAAITDHKKYNLINYAPDSGILVIPATEYDALLHKDDYGRIWHHTVCLGPTKEDGNGFEQDDFGPERPTIVDNEIYQKCLDEIHAKNNITIHAHPEWSRTPLSMFDCLKGNFAIEVCNSCGAEHSGMDADNGIFWDYLLAQGKRIWGVATDDAHGEWSYGGGWVMVNAEKNVNSVLKALKEGRFYASRGPEIYDFYVDDDNVAHIKCSPVKRIYLQNAYHATRMQPVNDRNEPVYDGRLICEASFKLEIKNGKYKYCRMTIVDENDKKAWTNPIFLV